MASMEPVVVVGGCGNLGHHIIKQLLERGVTKITAFDIETSKNIEPSVKYVKGDIASLDDVRKILEEARPRTVFHTASPSMLGQRNSREFFYNVNVNGTRNLIENILKLGVTKALVYTSSSGVIHNNYSDLVNATEDIPYCPQDKQPVYYSFTKAEAEKLVLGANRNNGLLTAAIRPTSLYGECDNALRTQIDNAKSGRGGLQVGDNKNLFDWTYLGNAAHGHILAAQALLKIDASKSEDDPKKVDGEAFVVHNDESWPFWDFPRFVGEVAGYPTKKEDIWVVPAWVFYIIAVAAEWWIWASSFGKEESQLNRQMVKYFSMNRTFDITKAKTRLGYRPLVNNEEGIRRGVKAYMEMEGSEKKKDI